MILNNLVQRLSRTRPRPISTHVAGASHPQTLGHSVECGTRPTNDPPQLSADDYTPDDLATVHALVTSLLATAAATATRHAPSGAWEPRADSTLDRLGEASALLDDLSRAVVRGRRELRAIDTRARERFYTRALSHIPRPRSY
ncbi:hypothetical protein ACIBBE_42960 [Streptomyces sp. NPDC051644]|uniref:hypothetical protein n=1 Tax=Streptomyces sp. NPDC051644 TaxID=3365666 RepID=UPI003799B385